MRATARGMLRGSCRTSNLRAIVVLVGLAAKNAILIVKLARDQQVHGASRFDAAVEAARVRLRPILMTSFAFMLGVFPPVIAVDAGAEMRQTLGLAVFAGMIGVLACLRLRKPFAFCFHRVSMRVTSSCARSMHSELEMSLHALDLDAVQRWTDDRILSFVQTYVALHENQYQLHDPMVTEPVSGTTFPKLAAGAKLERDGRTNDFVSEQTHREFEREVPGTGKPNRLYDGRFEPVTR